MDDAPVQVEAAFHTRLYWAGFRGLQRVAGWETRLQRPPLLCGQRVEAVDYIPGVLAQVMPPGERWRDMTAAEIAAARELLGLDAGTICVVVEGHHQVPQCDTH